MSKKPERLYAIDPGHYPDLLFYAFNYQTMQYVHGLRLKQMTEKTQVNRNSIYRSAQFNGHMLRNQWAFSYTYRKDWEHLSMQESIIKETPFIPTQKGNYYASQSQ